MASPPTPPPPAPGHDPGPEPGHEPGHEPGLDPGHDSGPDHGRNPGGNPGQGGSLAAGPTDEERGRARTRATARRALALGIGVSALLHVVVVILYPGLLDRVPEARVTSAPSPQDLPVQGIEIITFREEEDEPVAEEEEPPPEIILELPEPVESETPLALPTPVPPALPRPGEGARAAERDDRQRTAAERLRPQMGDPRIWVPLDRSVLDLSDEERAEIYLRSMIRSWNDSVAVAVALSGNATDWTYTDDEGRRWGLSPGRLHLGDYSIPLPLSFQLPPGRRDEAMRRNWEIQDILRGVASAEVRASWAERAREIRERMDAERARAGDGSGTSGPGGSRGPGGPGGPEGGGGN